MINGGASGRPSGLRCSRGGAAWVGRASAARQAVDSTAVGQLAGPRGRAEGADGRSAMADTQYNASPRQNASWMDSMAALGLSHLHLEGHAIDEEHLENVRSKRWGSAFKKAREEVCAPSTATP